MTDKELIQKLQTLRQIKPSEDWVLLAKNQLFASPVQAERAQRKVTYAELFKMLFQKRFAYAFAMILFVFAGSLGFFVVLPGSSKPESTPMLIAEKTVKSDAEAFKILSQNLALVAKNNPEELPSALKEVKKAASTLTETIKKDPQLAKTVALDINENKTYLNIAGSETIEETDDLYGTLVDSLLIDAEKAVWTDAQKEKLEQIKALRKEKRNSEALESYFIFISGNENTENNTENSEDAEIPVEVPTDTSTEENNSL